MGPQTKPPAGPAGFSVPGLDNRSAMILRELVETFVETGEPVGSRTLSRRLPLGLSPATIRNAMADLEDAGLLYAPHTSAGRLPTERGLRLFVDGLLEFGALGEEERGAIAARCAASGRSLQETLGEAGQMLSGLAGAAGLVVAPTAEGGAVRHIEFVALGPGRALVVLVHDDGQVENRVIEVPAGLPPSALVQASNYLNARLTGRTLEEARGLIAGEVAANRTALDALTQQVIEAGLGTWTGGQGGSLIIRGQARLLETIDQAARVSEIKRLFERLEQQETMLRLLDLAQRGEGVQIFIGAESGLFDSAGLSMVVAPFRNGQEKIVGAIGVIGPTRINYGRVIPVVDYTARVIGRLLG
ncbi:heat-inducible transcriptional repressor HrcA [Roseomonas terrae]|jgi:heat-inducible transcriptional repressor|uniref:Heat-inducible transcription repressor HrcA n=1 Tax=Neoroseomonas terrae TaxID=424799 RepID=A0ABS5EN70_9PROT|nr:heat-inducible transcriptional repressor HrcA [Neoroseomonas terrae]MBR0652487.1 heat-inducible transcriptional repressor HrcA [Neoroseomonas terrae]